MTAKAAGAVKDHTLVHNSEETEGENEMSSPSKIPTDIFHICTPSEPNLQ